MTVSHKISNVALLMFQENSPDYENINNVCSKKLEKHADTSLQ